MSEQPTSKNKLYAERDIIEQMQYYVNHVEAMTAEGLHSKSDIAAELAHRDIEIERLQRENIALRNLAENLRPGPISEALLGSMAEEYRQAGLSPEPEAIPDATRKLGELASAHIIMRLALQKIISDGDFTAPEGMKRIARSALDTTATAAALSGSLQPPSAACSAQTKRAECIHDLQRSDNTLRMHEQGVLVGWQCTVCSNVWMPAIAGEAEKQ